MLMPRRGGAVGSRIAHRFVVGLAVGAIALTLMQGTASAVVPMVPGGGSVRCSFSATIRFSPPLTRSGGGSRASGVKTALSQCTTYGAMEQVPRGWFQGHFAESPFSCATLAQTGATLTGSTRWAEGYDHGRRAKFENSPIRADDVNQGSFVGTARVVLDVPPSLSSQCAFRHGVRSASVTGTLTLGPACGPGHGALTIYKITPGPMCGDVYFPVNITAGSDGALWFTNGGENHNSTIGRITTSGVVSFYRLPDGAGASGLAAGSDGALWFTGGNNAGPLIGRITTSGVVTLYPVASGGPGPIAAGPDGTLWFVDYPAGNYTGAASIERITTSGTITAFTSPLIDGPAGITAGPDGAMWFANQLNHSIGRITTSGTVTAFTSPLITGPVDITAGPDGALWFTNSNSIGRITTSGTVTRYFSPSITNPWSITAGPDGAVWFSNYAGSPGIGRITTSGIVTAHYSDPSIVVPFDITSGPDGDVWFTNYGSDTIGRITPP
jgi:virginiamycin B lyase